MKNSRVRGAKIGRWLSVALCALALIGAGCSAEKAGPRVVGASGGASGSGGTASATGSGGAGASGRIVVDAAPPATGGDGGGDGAAGDAADAATDDAGGSVSLSLFNVMVGAVVKAFDPITADLNRVEMPPRFTLQANVPAATKSVAFQIGGQRISVDDAAPFRMNETAGVATPWAVTAGSYDVTVTAYAATGAQGAALGNLTRTVRILATGMDPNFVAQTDAQNLAWINQNVATVLVPKTFSSSTGKTMPYRFYTPKFVSTAVRYPLFLFLHGRAERGNNNETYRTLGTEGTNQLFVGPRSIIAPNMQQQFPSFVVVPQCAAIPDSEIWKGSDQEQLAFELLDTLLKDPSLPLDPDRVYITGLSMGGEGTWDFVVQRPTTFACAVPMSGLYDDTSKAPLIKDVPFWVFHSLADEMNGVSNSQQMVAAMMKAGAPVIKYTQYVTELHVATFMRAWSMEPDLLPWIFAWTRPK